MGWDDDGGGDMMWCDAMWCDGDTLTPLGMRWWRWWGCSLMVAVAVIHWPPPGDGMVAVMGIWCDGMWCDGMWCGVMGCDVTWCDVLAPLGMWCDGDGDILTAPGDGIEWWRWWCWWCDGMWCDGDVDGDGDVIWWDRIAWYDIIWCDVMLRCVIL